MLEGCRDFGLKDQMTRAAVSIASNIAEGAKRDSIKEFVRLLHIAKGSAAKLRTQVYIAAQIKTISEYNQKEIVSELIQISKMLHSLISSHRLNLNT